MTARATLTIKSRPLADGRVSWFLWIRRPRPAKDELIPVTHCHRAEDRAKVEEFAKPYRDALAKAALSEDDKKLQRERSTADYWYDRFVKSRMGKVSTASRDHQQWIKHISPILGKKTMLEITPDDIEAVRDYLKAEIDRWEGAGKMRGTGLAFATAANVWAVLTLAMKHASTREGDRHMRVREALGNPASAFAHRVTAPASAVTGYVRPRSPRTSRARPSRSPGSTPSRSVSTCTCAPASWRSCA
jgi:hypothetical protein